MHTLPHLPYDYDALEPVIDTTTMQIHHTRHHQAYIDKLNVGLSTYPQYKWLSIVELLTQFDTLPEDLQPIVQNHWWWHANHSLFRKTMIRQTESESTKLDSVHLMQAIDSVFGSFDVFVEQFTAAALSRFGSGWAWLVKDGQTLSIRTTANQDSPLMQGKIPLLGLDVWEHAYYLRYQNKRADYIAAWFSIVNWKQVEKNYLA